MKGLPLKSGDLSYGLILIGFIALPFNAGIVMKIQITVRTLVTFVLLRIMSSFQDFIFLLSDFVTIISSLRDLLGRGFLTTMKRGSE